MKWRTGEIPEGENVLFQIKNSGGAETHAGYRDGDSGDVYLSTTDTWWELSEITRWIPLSEVLEAIECPSKT